VTQEERDVHERIRQAIIKYMPDVFSDGNLTEEEKAVMAQTISIIARAKAMHEL
jgi:DNA-binding phage protein